jgi:hypothetical protein
MPEFSNLPTQSQERLEVMSNSLIMPINDAKQTRSLSAAK